jgi:uncharacterized protein YdhG (YjbR/CyaY superfamily)
MKTVQQGTIDEYIAGYPKEVQQLLQDLRSTIRKAAPDAAESINYGIPTFTLNGNLVHFGAYKNHIGFYPAPSGIKAFEKELSVYDGAKGSIKFPIEKPLPLSLISKIVTFRVKENLEKAAAKVKPAESFLSSLSAPARRALENKGISTLKQLSKFRKEEILALHGMGPGSIPKLTSALNGAGLSFKNS